MNHDYLVLQSRDNQLAVCRAKSGPLKRPVWSMTGFKYKHQIIMLEKMWFLFNFISVSGTKVSPTNIVGDRCCSLALLVKLCSCSTVAPPGLLKSQALCGWGLTPGLSVAFAPWILSDVHRLWSIISVRPFVIGSSSCCNSRVDSGYTSDEINTNSWHPGYNRLEKGNDSVQKALI